MSDVATIAAALSRYRLPVGREDAYQRVVEAVLKNAGLDFEPQFDLGIGLGRVDIFVGALGLGIELKVKGSPSDVTAQLHRYAQSDEIKALMLVTGRVALGRLPRTLLGKPLTIVPTWRGGL